MVNKIQAMGDLACTGQPAVEDWELDAYIDGEASPHVQAHLEECLACRIRLTERLLFERRLRRALHRSESLLECPSPHLLRDYYWGNLAVDERGRIDEHLKTCVDCTQELKGLDEFLTTEQDAPLRDIMSRAQQAAEQACLVLAHFVSPAPQAVPVLRGETREVLLFEANDVALSINLEQDELGTYTLFGQVLMPEFQPLSGGYARLTSADAEPRQTSIDANSGFALSGLKPGIYQLVVQLPTLHQRIVAPRLALKAAL
jgi:hypothetical protein